MLFGKKELGHYEGASRNARSENDETIKSVDKEDVTIFFVPNHPASLKKAFKLNWNESQITVTFTFYVI